jgi:hypothetical protein
MSDEKRIIANIESFYSILDQNEDVIFKDSTLATIKDYLDAAYKGCSCKRKTNEDKAIELYKVLHTRIDQSVINELKARLNIKEFMFFYETHHLFNL